jgi:hypothetical protein
LKKLSSIEKECFRQIFETIGTTNKFFVEIGFDGHFDREMIPDWTGVYVDKKLPPEAQFVHHVKLVEKFVTCENLNSLLKDAGVPPKSDLFAIDIDGNEYHILKALTATDPNVIISEYNSSFGPELNVTIPYDAYFTRDRMPLYHGASLGALNKLLSKRGFSLVGCEHYGVNAFFVKKELCKDKLKVYTVTEAFVPSVHRECEGTWQTQLQKIKSANLELMEI